MAQNTGKYFNKRSKYGAVRTEYNGVMYDSKKESEYAKKLDILKFKGIIKRIERQVRFDYELIAALPPMENYPAPVQRTVSKPYKRRYIIDFIVHYTDGHIEYVDVKGHRTAEYIMKKSIIEQLFAIKIKEV